MFELKPLHRDAIAAAIEKVHRYRLLNEPVEAESICLDILEAEPGNQTARMLLLLARTDQFEEGMNPARARELLSGFENAYDRAYYAGIILERTAKAILKQHRPGFGHTAYEQLRQAMDCYEKAETLRPAGNDDAILRWNCCVRLLARYPELKPRPADAVEPVLSE